MTATETLVRDNGRPLALFGAIAVLAGGVLHTRLAFDGYGTDDLITTFFVNGIASAAIAAWIAYDRRPLAPIAGLGISVMSLLAFGLSRVGDGVVGFRGTGLDPSPDALLTLVVEALAVVLLGIHLVARRRELTALVQQLPLPGRNRETSPAG